MVATKREYILDSANHPVLRKCLSSRERGFSVLPLEGKNPNYKLVPRWSVLRNKPASLEEIVEWFRRYPQGNYGNILGEKDVVLDVDHPSLFPKDLYLPPTLKISTGREEGGYHAYLHDDNGSLTYKTYPWGEVRTCSYYVVGEGSVHPDTGKVYQRISDSSEIAEMPEHLRGQLLELQRGEDANTSTDPIQPSVLVLARSYPESDRQKGIDVRSYFCSLGIAFKAMRFMGYEVRRLEQSVPCPWHDDDKRPSATIVQGEDSQIMIRDYHSIGCKRSQAHGKNQDCEWLSIPDVFAKHLTGKKKILNHGEYCVWGLRLLGVLGEIALPTIDAPDLPNDAPPSAKKVWDGFRHLLRVRQFYLPDQKETPFSSRFAMRWCNIGSLPTVTAALAWLRENSWLTISGHIGGSKTKRSCNLYTVLDVKPPEDVEGSSARIEVGKLDDWRLGRQPVPAVLNALAYERSGRNENE
jgi:hypothetical protein